MRTLKILSMDYNQSRDLAESLQDQKLDYSDRSTTDDRFLTDDDTSTLEGTVLLNIKLPDEGQVQMEVDANTPMMDLLVQVTSKNGMSPGGLILKVPSDRPPGYLTYKPNTPVGRLETQRLEVVSKFDVLERPHKLKPKMANQPFEPTVRVQVDLSRSQKVFLRFSPKSTLSDLLSRICSEQSLDQNLCTIRASAAPDLPLNLHQPLGQAGTLHFVVISRGGHIRTSTGDRVEADQKMPVGPKQRQKSKGILGGIFKKKNDSTSSVHTTRLTGTDNANNQDSVAVNGDEAEDVRFREIRGVNSSFNRPLSMPAISGCESLPAARQSANPYAPRKRKKRPAPPPPAEAQSDDFSDGPLAASEKKNMDIADKRRTALPHTRHSSDSSGYQDGSVQSHSSPLGIIHKLRDTSIADKLVKNLQGSTTAELCTRRPVVLSDVSSDQGIHSERSGSSEVGSERTNSPCSSDYQGSLGKEFSRKGAADTKGPKLLETLEETKSKKYKAPAPPPPPVLPEDQQLGAGDGAKKPELQITTDAVTGSGAEEKEGKPSTNACTAENSVPPLSEYKEKEIDQNFQEIIHTLEQELKTEAHNISQGDTEVGASVSQQKAESLSAEVPLEDQLKVKGPVERLSADVPGWKLPLSDEDHLNSARKGKGKEVVRTTGRPTDLDQVIRDHP